MTHVLYMYMKICSLKVAMMIVRTFSLSVCVCVCAPEGIGPEMSLLVYCDAHVMFCKCS